MKTSEARFSLKGCQIVAGGRSVPQTTGTTDRSRTLEGCQRFLPPFLGGNHLRYDPVVSTARRPPATI